MKEFYKMLFRFLICHKVVKQGDLGHLIIHINRDGVSDVRWGDKKVEVV